jgi:hypothetical protein
VVAGFQLSISGRICVSAEALIRKFKDAFSQLPECLRTNDKIIPDHLLRSEGRSATLAMAASFRRRRQEP